MEHNCKDCPCLQNVMEKLDHLEKAFPEGPIPHRAAHEAWIRARQAEAEFWKELKMEVAKKGALGFMYLIGGFLILGIAVKLGITIKP